MSDDGRKITLVSGNQDTQVSTIDEAQFGVRSLVAILKQRVQVATGKQSKDNLKQGPFGLQQNMLNHPF